LIYDSRIVHRGGQNHSYDYTRVGLIFRYDFDRPPGYGMVGSLLLGWTGKFTAAMLRAYGALPGEPTTAGRHDLASVSDGSAGVATKT